MGRVFLQRLPATAPPAPGAAPAASSAASTPEAAAGADALDAPGPGHAGVVFSCASCGAHLAPRAAVISKNFHGRTGPAFLLSHAINVAHGAAEQRDLMSGRHVVRDTFCACCCALVGWSYLKTPEGRPELAYKVGTLVLEQARLQRELLPPRAAH